MARAAGAPQPPPCFIVGPPRSGTTLLYQLLVRRYRFAYISNLAHRLYETPCTATLLGRPLLRGWRGEFRSRYGHTAGWGAPNEGGWVWRRWLPEPEPLPVSLLAELPLDEIRGTIGALSRIMNGPFLNKNVMHSVRMALLAELFPGCGFLQVLREPRENVRSILRAEASGGGTLSDGWWSVKPREWKRFAGMDAVVRGAAQVHYVARDIQEDAAALGPHRLLAVDYGRLCEEPRAVAEDVGRFLDRLGSGAEPRGEVPERFDAPPSRRLDVETEEQIEAALRKVAGP